MDSYTISQLGRYSGIKPHTIRMWEQRYNALKPNRSKGNTRYYDNAQLRRLLNIVSLIGTGRKVSELCAMSDNGLFKLVEELHNIPEKEAADYLISQLISAGINYEEPHFEKIFSNCLLRYGMRDAYIKVFYPMMKRIGLLWATDAIHPAHEHFISNMFRQKLFAGIDALPPAKQDSSSWLLFLPEDELHEIGLLLAHYLIRLAGRKVLYLGSNTPKEALIAAVESISPQNMFLFLVHHDAPKDVQAYFDWLRNCFARGKIYVAGNTGLIDRLTLDNNTFWLKSVEDLEKQLFIYDV